MRDSLVVSVGIRPTIVSHVARPHHTLRIDKSHTQASQSVDTVNVHSTASANTLTAASSESQCRVDLILNTNQSIQHHRTGLVQVKGIALHTRLLGGSIGIPAVDMEGLGTRRGGRGRFLDRRGLRLGHELAAGGGSFADLGERVNGGIGACEDRGGEQWAGRGQQASGAKGGHGGHEG